MRRTPVAAVARGERISRLASGSVSSVRVAIELAFASPVTQRHGTTHCV
jgi:hypothetical protein